MTKDEFKIAWNKACDETKGCVVFERAEGHPIFWYEGTLDHAYNLYQKHNCINVRASRDDEDTEL